MNAGVFDKKELEAKKEREEQKIHATIARARKSEDERDWKKQRKLLNDGLPKNNNILGCNGHSINYSLMCTMNFVFIFKRTAICLLAVLTLCGCVAKSTGIKSLPGDDGKSTKTAELCVTNAFGKTKSLSPLDVARKSGILKINSVEVKTNGIPKVYVKVCTVVRGH